MSGLTIAVPRGALLGETLDLLDRIGIDTAEVRANDRKLLFADAGIVTMRPSDVPTYVEAGVLHYAVTNMPALAPRTATRALTNATLPFVEALAVLGSPAALQADPTLAHGLTIRDDQLVCAPTAAALGLPAIAVGTALPGRVPLSLSA